MRYPMVALTAALLVGCSADRLTLDHQSTMWSETRGLALHDDGTTGHAAMWDTTCEFDVVSGTLLGDIDLPTDSESISDAWGGTALAISSEGVHQVVLGSWTAENDIEAEGVVTARLFDAGVATLRQAGDTCLAGWNDGSSTVEVDVPDGLCAPTVSVSIDRETGLVYAATGDDLVVVSPEGATSFGTSADLVAWDDTAYAAYAARTGTDTLSAFSADGGLLWETETGGAVVSLADLGDHGAVVVVVEQGDAGALEVYDGVDGHDRGDYQLPEVAEIVTSDAGDTVAMVLSEQVYFFSVGEGSGVNFESGGESSDRPAPRFSD